MKAKHDVAYDRLMWDYKNADIPGLKGRLRKIDWSGCLESNDIDMVAKTWTSTLLSVAREYIPNKMVLVRPNDKPWYNNQLRRFKRKVLRAFKYAKAKRDDDSAWSKYKSLNNEYHDSVKKTKKAFEDRRYDNLRLSCKTNPKSWWHTVKQLLGYAQDTTIPTLLINNESVTDSLGKADYFNHFFASHSNIDTTN